MWCGRGGLGRSALGLHPQWVFIDTVIRSTPHTPTSPWDSISLPDSGDGRPQSTQVLHGCGTSVDVPQNRHSLLSRPACAVVPSLKSLFWSESQVTSLTLRTLSSCCLEMHWLSQRGPPRARHLLVASSPGTRQGSLLPAPSLPSLRCSEVFRLALTWSLPSALVPWPCAAHSSRESMKEMPLTQKFTLGAVKRTPES